MHRPLIIVGILMLQMFLLNNLNAQEVEKKIKDRSIIALPVIFYLPETRLGFGGVGRFSFRWQEQEVDKISSVDVGAVYTLNKQLLLNLPYNLYFKEDTFWFKGEFGYFDYFYPFRGFGHENRVALESYTVNFPRIESDLLYKVKGECYIGVGFRIDSRSDQEFEEGGLLMTQDIQGKQGGVTAGLGPVLIFDRRDHINFPSKGSLIQLKYFQASELFASDYNFSFFEYGLSKYFPKGKNVLALNTYGKAVFGDIPFYEYARYGGGKQARGYLLGSFRDKNAIGFQAEYRMVFKKRFGAAIFVNVGTVFDDFNAVNLENALPAIGTGLRYTLSEEQRLNMRVDVGLGKEGLQFYFTFGEAF